MTKEINAKEKRECNKCGNVKPLKEYYKRVKPSGYVCYMRKCKACCQAERRERYANDPAYREHTKTRSIAGYARRREKAVAQKAKYREENRQKINESKMKEYYADIEKSRKNQRDRYKADPDSAKKRREWRAKNIERSRLTNKLYRLKKGDELRMKKNIYYAAKRKTDIKYSIRSRLSSRIRLALRRYLKGIKVRKYERSSILLGCSVDEFKQKLESQFTEGMTWAKFLEGEIHIDHIMPCVSFDLTKEKEQYKCFHHTNLQPLWAKDNLIKGSKITILKND
jgi:hypothetical protein